MQARSDALDAASAALKQAGQTAPPPVDHEAAARHRVTPRRPVPPPQTEAPPERPHRRVPQNRPGEERPDLGTETPHREPRSTPLPPLPPNRTDRPPAETDSLRTRPNELAVPPQGPFSARRDIDTSKFDVGQPDVRTCGIAALTSALGDFDALHPIMQANGIGNTRDFMERMKSNKDTLTVPPHYDRRTGEYVEGGLQTGLDGLARAARDLGHLQTEMVHQQKGVDIMAQLDAQIIQGRGAIAHVINLGQGNPGYGGTHNPHYVYIAGKTPDGKNYIVNDSGHGTQRRSGFSHVYVETPEHVRRMIESKGDGFAAVWR